MPLTDRAAALSFCTLLLLTGCGHSALHTGQKVDKIVVIKSTHTMTLFSAGHPLKTYKVSLGRGSGSAKHQQDDHETPEGTYRIDAKNPNSRFHLALHISYPNVADKARAAALHQPTGGDIMIHGLEPKFAWLESLQRHVDWTDGCIAVTNSEMDEIWYSVPNGTRIEIRKQ